MADAVIRYTDEDTGTVFEWGGGAYIDVGYDTPKKDIDAPPPAYVFRAEDVINVWDDEADVSVFELRADGFGRPFRNILEQFEKRCEQYLLDEDQ